jgi:hypothetical protein
VNSVLNLGVPENAGKLLNGLTTCGLSSSAQLHTFSPLEKHFFHFYIISVEEQKTYFAGFPLL